jgi:hypothetical protein
LGVFPNLTKTLWCIGNQINKMATLSKIEKLTKVRTKLSEIYDSYDEDDFSSPEYEIDEHISEYLLKDISLHFSVKLNPSKLHTIVRYYLDDSIENLYLNGVSEGIVEDISQSEAEQIIDLILQN